MRNFLGRNCLAEIGMLMLLSFGVCGAGRADDDPKPSRASATSAAKPPSTNREESGLPGRGGITPPGGNNGSPQFFTCSNGTSSGQTSLGPAETACGGGLSSVWFPDLRKNESFIDLAIMVKF